MRKFCNGILRVSGIKLLGIDDTMKRNNRPAKVSLIATCMQDMRQEGLHWKDAEVYIDFIAIGPLTVGA